MAGHLAHNLFRKCAGLRGDAQQNRNLGVAHRIKQRNCARTRQFPSRHVGFFVHQRLLAGAYAFASLHKQPVAIEAVDPLAGLFLGQPFFLHAGNNQIADADAR